MIRLAMAGAGGRMGRTILSLAAADSNFKITGAFESAGNSAIGTDVGILIGSKKIGVAVTSDMDKTLTQCDVLIDFTHPSATEANLKSVLKSKVGYVLGTTGLTEALLKNVAEAAKKIPIVQSPNMSVGVNLLLKLVELTSEALDESYDIEIVEAHHRMKKDSPSGTALKLLEVAAKARGRSLKKDVVYGREGEIGARPRGQIGVMTVRGGDVVGDHTVYYLGDGERIELTHKASSRGAFAQGALKAAKFVADKKPALYNMRQVLGIA